MNFNGNGHFGPVSMARLLLCRIITFIASPWALHRAAKAELVKKDSFSIQRRRPSTGGSRGLAALAYRTTPEWWWEFLLREEQNLNAISAAISIKISSCWIEFSICFFNFFGLFAKVLVHPEETLLWACRGATTDLVAWRYPVWSILGLLLSDLPMCANLEAGLWILRHWSSVQPSARVRKINFCFCGNSSAVSWCCSCSLGRIPVGICALYLWELLVSFFHCSAFLISICHGPAMLYLLFLQNTNFWYEISVFYAPLR